MGDSQLLDAKPLIRSPLLGQGLLFASRGGQFVWLSGCSGPNGPKCPGPAGPLMRPSGCDAHTISGRLLLPVADSPRRAVERKGPDRDDCDGAADAANHPDGGPTGIG
jgi:hypothetical protein